MNLLHSSPWRHLAALLAAGAAVLLTGGCASTSSGAATDDASAGTRRSSIEAFGVIDAGVSRSTSKSDRR